MKPNWHLIILISGLLLLASAMAQYTIDWHSLDSGGDASTGGVYSVSGTIGQPDVGEPMTGGTFSLTGGFWAIYAVQTEGAPFLSIVISGPSEVTISWEPDDPGWVLQETPSLTPAVWADSPSMATNPVVVPITLPVQFYRLSNP